MGSPAGWSGVAQSAHPSRPERQVSRALELEISFSTFYPALVSGSLSERAEVDAICAQS